MFTGINIVDKFAATLSVSVPHKTIALIVPTDDGCRSEDCPLNAVKGNYGFCPAHQRTWYPPANERGGDWHGPEFLRSISGHFRVCDCDAVSCKSAGYFPMQGTLYVPVAGRETAINTPNLLSGDKNQELRKNKNKKLYLDS